MIECSLCARIFSRTEEAHSMKVIFWIFSIVLLALAYVLVRSSGYLPYGTVILHHLEDYGAQRGIDMPMLALGFLVGLPALLLLFRSRG